MKRLLALLSLTLSITALAGNPYVGTNITRTYDESELESCPGVLDMQPGDLWTLTLPDNITDSFLTRDGLVERKVQGNRVVMAVTATSGSSPMLVMTEDGHALRFMITIQGGVGGRNKNVVIKPGWGSSKACAGALPVTPGTSAVQVAAPTLIRVNVPQASAAPSKAVSAARPPLPPAKVLPTQVVKAPLPLTARKPASAKPTAVTKPAAVKAPSPSPQPVRAATVAPATTPATATAPHAQTPIPVTVRTPPAPMATVTLEATAPLTRATPAAPTPTVTVDATPAPTPTTTSTPASLPGRVSAVLASSPSYLTATVLPEAQGRVLNIHITSRLDADVMLNEQDLTLGDAKSTSQRQVMVPAGQALTLTLRLQGPLPKRQGRLLWTGSILGSGETFLLSATLPLPA